MTLVPTDNHILDLFLQFQLPVSELQSSMEKEEEKLKSLMPEGPTQEQIGNYDIS